MVIKEFKAAKWWHKFSLMYAAGAIYVTVYCVLKIIMLTFDSYLSPVFGMPLVLIVTWYVCYRIYKSVPPVQLTSAGVRHPHFEGQTSSDLVPWDNIAHAKAGLRVTRKTHIPFVLITLKPGTYNEISPLQKEQYGDGLVIRTKVLDVSAKRLAGEINLSLRSYRNKQEKTPPSSNFSTVEKFSRALDSDYIALAKNFVDDKATYQYAGSTYVGPDAICQHYKQEAFEKQTQFDELFWLDGKVEQVSETDFTIEHVNELKHRGTSHTYRHQVAVSVGSNGKIMRLQQLEHAGQQQSLDAFMCRVGLADAVA